MALLSLNTIIEHIDHFFQSIRLHPKIVVIDRCYLGDFFFGRHNCVQLAQIKWLFIIDIPKGLGV